MPYKDKGKLREYQRNWVRDRVSKYKEGISCIVCGESEAVCLDFHHTGEKTGKPSKLIRSGSRDRIKKELDKTVVLCSNCHRKVHAGIVVL